MLLMANAGEWDFFSDNPVFFFDRSTRGSVTIETT